MTSLGLHTQTPIPAESLASSEHIQQPRHQQQHVCLCGKSYKRGCFMRALRSFMYTFSIAYGLRSTLALLLRAVHLARSRPRSLLSISALVSEKHVSYREDAVRLGLFSGVFCGGFNLLRCALQAWRGQDPLNTLLAGFFAGGSILFIHKDSQRTFALYVFVRLVQCLYNEAKARKLFTPIPHGDSLLFIISSAQVMYAYVMRPDTLPPSFWNFIVRTGPIDTRVLSATRAICRGKPFDGAAITGYLAEATPKGQVPLSFIGPAADCLPGILPCTVVHPTTAACSANAVRVFVQAFRRVFPLYASLTLVPMFVLRLTTFLRSPVTQIVRAAFSAGRSTTFLASFVGLYQSAVCFFRKTCSQDHRFSYFAAGLVSSLSIFIERKERRSELALYCLPRAADSLFMLLRDRRWLASVPYGEILLFCSATSGLMYFFHEQGGRSVSPLVNTVLNVGFGRYKL